MGTLMKSRGRVDVRAVSTCACCAGACGLRHPSPRV